MKIILVATLILAASALQPQLPPQEKKVRCLIKTELGDITIEVLPDKAPITAANFLEYVDRQAYDNTTFFRVVTLQNQPRDKVKIEVIQGGTVSRSHTLPSIPHESTDKTGLIHAHGTLSMARGKPGTATSSFFICIHDQPELDFGGTRHPDGQGFAAFGQVVAGMKVVDKISKMENEKQRLKKPVLILSIRRFESPPDEAEK